MDRVFDIWPGDDCHQGEENGVASQHLTFEILEDSANLPDPDIIAAEIDSRIPICSVAAATLTVHLARSHGSIVEDLQAALAQFAEIANDLQRQHERIVPTE